MSWRYFGQKQYKRKHFSFEIIFYTGQNQKPQKAFKSVTDDVIIRYSFYNNKTLNPLHVEVNITLKLL